MNKEQWKHLSWENTGSLMGIDVVCARCQSPPIDDRDWYRCYRHGKHLWSYLCPECQQELWYGRCRQEPMPVPWGELEHMQLEFQL